MKKVEISFEHSDGKIDIIGCCGEFESESNLAYPLFTFKNSFLMINRFLTNYPRFKHYYTRINYPKKDGNPFVYILDVGSWTEFFYVTYKGEEWEGEGEDYLSCSKEFFSLNNPEAADNLLRECDDNE